jgi:hypothetical protein
MSCAAGLLLGFTQKAVPQRPYRQDRSAPPATYLPGVVDRLSVRCVSSSISWSSCMTKGINTAAAVARLENRFSTLFRDPDRRSLKATAQGLASGAGSIGAK